MAELFSKVKQEIEKGFSAVSVRSKEVLESMKIKKQVESLKEQMTNSTAELGRTVYFMYNQNNLDQTQISEKCAAISAIDKQLTEKEAELKQLHLESGEALGKSYCTNCKAEVTEGFRFCSQCGAKIPERMNIDKESNPNEKTGV